MQPDEVLFGTDDRDAVVRGMASLAADHHGWLNVAPVLPAGVDPPRQGLMRFLGARGPEALLATWVPGETSRDGLAPDTVGLQHAAGKRVVARLAEAGRPVPDGWRVTQDHPSRGVVATLPVGADLDEVLRWLLGAAEEVSTVPVTGRWKAAFYRPG